MKKIIPYMIMLLLSLFLTSGAYSFVLTSINPFEWDAIYKSLFSVTFLVFFVLILISYNETNKEY